jgi:hypothetical protein
MGFNLGDIFVTFKTKSEGVKEVVGQIKDVNEQATEGVSKLNKFANGFKDFSKVTGGALITVGAGLTLYAKQATDFTTEYVGNAKRLAREIGTNVTEASRLTYAFTRLGLSTDDVSGSFGIFSRKISDATKSGADNRAALASIQNQMEKTRFEINATSEEIKRNGDKSGELGIKLRGLQADLHALELKAKDTGTTFDKLGISVLDNTGKQKDFGAILFEVADKFKGMPDGVEKTALSMDLFGRSGKDMIKVLNQGSDGIKELEKQADKLGITLTDKTVGGVAKMIEAGKKLKENQDAIKIAVGTLTAPVLADYTNMLANLVGKFQELDQPSKTIVANILAFGGPVATAAGSVLTFVGSLGDASATIDKFAPKIPIVGSFFQAFGKFLTNPWVLAITAIVVVVGLLLNHFGELQPFIDAVVNTSKDLWEVLQMALKPAMDSLKDSLVQLAPLWPPLLAVLKFLAEIIGGIVVAAIVGFVAAIAGIVTIFAYVGAAVLVWVNYLKALIIGWVNDAIAKWNELAALPGKIGKWLADAGRTVDAGMRSISDGIKNWINDFFNSGKALFETFAKGITAGFTKTKDSINAGLNWIRDRLPHSDAKEGPLSELTYSGKKLMETLAVGVGKGAGSLYDAVEGTFAGLPSGMVSAGVGVSSSIAGGSGSSTAGSGSGSSVAMPAGGGGSPQFHFHLDGIMTRSRGELRDVLMDGLEAVDEKLIAQGRQPILRRAK